MRDDVRRAAFFDFDGTLIPGDSIVSFLLFARRRGALSLWDLAAAALHALLKSLRVDYPEAVILGHRDLPNVHKDCPCFDAQQEYKDI